MRIRVVSVVSFAFTIAGLFALTSCSFFVSSWDPLQAPAYFALVANWGSNNISVYSMDKTTGALSEVAGSPFSAGTNPKSIAIDPSGHFVYVANFGSDSISIFSLNKKTGFLTPISILPFALASELHSVVVDRQGRFAYVSGSGTSVFAIDTGTGKLTAISGSPLGNASTMWQTVIDQSGKLLFLSMSYDISACIIDQTTGAITLAPGSPHATGSQAARAIALGQSGEFVYVLETWSPISIFSINSATGGFTEIAGSPFDWYQSLRDAGVTDDLPEGIAIDPAGKFLYITSSTYPSSPQHIQAFSINESSGSLTSINGSLLVTGTATSGGYQCMNPSIDPTGTFLYVTNRGSNDIAAYAINQATGILTPLSGSTFPAGTGPGMIVTVQIP
jgi:6-phosphogluconolactonase (cycloisomerase 2 family)